MHIQIEHLSFGSSNVCPSVYLFPSTVHAMGQVPQQWPGGFTGFMQFKGGQLISLHSTVPSCKEKTSMVLCQCTADHVTEAWGITLTDFIYLIWKHIIPLSSLRLLVGLSCLTPLSTIFQLYREGNGSTWRKPLTCRKSLTNFIK